MRKQSSRNRNGDNVQKLKVFPYCRDQPSSFSIERFVEAKKMIKEHARGAHPGADVARGNVPSPVPWNHPDKAAAYAFHRLRADYAFTNAVLYYGKGY